MYEISLRSREIESVENKRSEEERSESSSEAYFIKRDG
jgi:hypothetical protein